MAVSRAYVVCVLVVLTFGFGATSRNLRASNPREDRANSFGEMQYSAETYKPLTAKETEAVYGEMSVRATVPKTVVVEPPAEAAAALRETAEVAVPTQPAKEVAAEEAAQKSEETSSAVEEKAVFKVEAAPAKTEETVVVRQPGTLVKQSQPISVSMPAETAAQTTSEVPELRAVETTASSATAETQVVETAETAILRETIPETIPKAPVSQSAHPTYSIPTETATGALSVSEETATKDRPEVTSTKSEKSAAQVPPKTAQKTSPGGPSETVKEAATGTGAEEATSVPSKLSVDDPTSAVALEHDQRHIPETGATGHVASTEAVDKESLQLQGDQSAQSSLMAGKGTPTQSAEGESSDLGLMGEALESMTTSDEDKDEHHLTHGWKVVAWIIAGVCVALMVVGMVVGSILFRMRPQESLLYYQL